MSEESLVRVRVFVEGRVQGVGFRYSAYREAGRLRVSGWARNLPDGKVEAVFEGTRAAVETMVAWARHGPARAHVTGLVLYDEAPQGETGFSTS